MIITREARLGPEARRGMKGAKAIRDFSTIFFTTRYVKTLSLIKLFCRMRRIRVVYENRLR
jgi:hypothetical protein